MKVTRKSQITGKAASMELPITMAQWAEWMSSRRTRLIQDIFPQLTNEQREFLKTGITPEEWDKHIRKDDNE
jgi:hypothetical protein